MLLIKLLVVILLLFIIISLFSGLGFLIKDKGQTKRTVNALTVRIVLSLIAFALLMIAGFTGLITPNSGPY
jgi:hypothetical protein